MRYRLTGPLTSVIVFSRVVSAKRYVQMTRAALWSLALIVVSGAAVRLTGSGLGCSDWPNCEENQFVASVEYHALIEFVNRLFTGVVAVAVIVAVLGSRRLQPRRRDLERWSWGLVAGVLAQVLLGALLVKTNLDPRFTMGHFLVSMVLLWNATVLVHEAQRNEPTPRGRRGLSRGTAVVMGWGGVLLVSGTIVTGSGPHSGSDQAEVAERLGFLVREVTRVHSLIAIGLLLGIVAVMLCAKGRPHIVRLAQIVAALLLLQGAIGYWQYFAGVPVQLVAVHITLASLTWITIVRLDLVARGAS